MALDNDVERLWSEDMSTDKMNNRTFKIKPAYSWNAEVEENEEKVINVHVRWDEKERSPKIRFFEYSQNPILIISRNQILIMISK